MLYWRIPQIHIFVYKPVWLKVSISQLDRTFSKIQRLQKKNNPLEPIDDRKD